MAELTPDSVRTFSGRSSREVYARIRAEFGADAVIIDQRTERGVVMVRASRDFPAVAENAPTGVEVYQRRLKELGFADEFIARLPPAGSWQQLKTTVAGSVCVEPAPLRLQGAYRFVGAPGVGKTTSIIKLIAEHVLSFGAASCGLVSTDQRRLAGSEQLALAAELLGVEFRETPPSRLDETLLTLADRELVLIDTAGASVGQPACEPASCPDIVVLPATWRAGALRRTCQLLPVARAAGVILTQVDQCDSLSDVVSVLSELRIPLRWLSNGPDLYDDLEPVNRKLLLDLLFPEIDRSENSTTFA